MIPSALDSWPLMLEAADEWAGDEWLDDPSSFANHAAFGGSLDEAAYRAADARFLALYRAILKGERPFDDPELETLADALHLPWGERGEDRRPPKLAAFAVEDQLLADIVEDLVPDIPLHAGDRVLGPWVDQSPSRRLMVLAAAVCAWMPLLDEGVGAVQRWSKSRPRPPLVLRQAVHAIARVPPMLYDRDWRPLLPLGQRYRVDGPVRTDLVPLAGSVEVVVARIVPLEDGSWWAATALGLPACPPLEGLQRRLDLELLRLRRHERRTNWEMLLRARPELLYRECATWCWLQGHEPGS